MPKAQFLARRNPGNTTSRQEKILVARLPARINSSVTISNWEKSQWHSFQAVEILVTQLSARRNPGGKIPARRNPGATTSSREKSQ
jgi:hypothetical protein